MCRYVRRYNDYIDDGDDEKDAENNKCMLLESRKYHNGCDVG